MASYGGIPKVVRLRLGRHRQVIEDPGRLVSESAPGAAAVLPPRPRAACIESRLCRAQMRSVELRGALRWSAAESVPFPLRGSPSVIPDRRRRSVARRSRAGSMNHPDVRCSRRFLLANESARALRPGQARTGRPSRCFASGHLPVDNIWTGLVPVSPRRRRERRFDGTHYTSACGTSFDTFDSVDSSIRDRGIGESPASPAAPLLEPAGHLPSLVPSTHRPALKA